MKDSYSLLLKNNANDLPLFEEQLNSFYYNTAHHDELVKELFVRESFNDLAQETSQELTDCQSGFEVIDLYKKMNDHVMQALAHMQTEKKEKGDSSSIGADSLIPAMIAFITLMNNPKLFIAQEAANALVDHPSFRSVEDSGVKSYATVVVNSAIEFIKGT